MNKRFFWIEKNIFRMNGLFMNYPFLERTHKDQEVENILKQIPYESLLKGNHNY